MNIRIESLVREYKAGLEAIYGERLRGAYLYGSCARGEEDAESDVDVVVVLDAVARYGAEVDRTGDLTSALSLKYGLSISRVFVSQQDWMSGAPPFAAMARAEAIPA
jgi:predicted nucleotidyltransferase